jgi:hypothetical protein
MLQCRRNLGILCWMKHSQPSIATGFESGDSTRLKVFKEKKTPESYTNWKLNLPYTEPHAEPARMMWGTHLHGSSVSLQFPSEVRTVWLGPWGLCLHGTCGPFFSPLFPKECAEHLQSTHGAQ